VLVDNILSLVDNILLKVVNLGMRQELSRVVRCLGYVCGAKRSAIS